MLQSSTVEEEDDDDEEEEEEEEEEELASSGCSGDGRLRFLLGCPPLVLPVPSQSGHETHPLPLYTTSGALGMIRGRCPLLRHSFHSFTLFKLY